MPRILCAAVVFLLIMPFISNAQTIDIMIKGIDDGVASSKQQDYNEAVVNAKLQAIERAGVNIQSIVRIVSFQTKVQQVENTAKTVLVPGFQIMDIGYLTTGAYQVVLVGKVKTVSEAPPLKSEAKNKTLNPATGYNGRFVADKNGVILDTKTDLEWYAGSDSDTSWYGAKFWVWNLDIAGGDWKLPSIRELQTLYNTGKYDGSPLQKIAGDRVWSAKTKDFSTAFFFDFTMAREHRYDKSIAPSAGRVLAVRPRRQ